MLDAPAGHVLQVVEDAAPGPLERVEQHALPQRVLAEHQLLDRARLEHALEDQGAGQDDVGPPRLHPGQRRRPCRPCGPTTSSVTTPGELVGGEPRAVPRRRLGLARADGGPAGRAARSCPTSRPRPRGRAGWPDGRSRDTIAATWRRHDDTADGWTFDPSGKKRLVSRSAPSLRLTDGEEARPARPTMSSVLPPPMSHTSTRRSKTGSAWSTPRWMRRASSTPETISTSTPASRCDPVEEVVVVLGLTHRAGGHGPHRRVEAVGDPPAAGERGDAPLDGVVLEAASCRPTRCRAAPSPSRGSGRRSGRPHRAGRPRGAPSWSRRRRQRALRARPATRIGGRCHPGAPCTAPDGASAIAG